MERIYPKEIRAVLKTHKLLLFSHIDALILVELLSLIIFFFHSRNKINHLYSVLPKMGKATTLAKK